MLRRAAIALTFLVALLLLPPWIPAMPGAGLDASWIAALTHAFNSGWQFGPQIIFTYGPYAFLAAGVFDPANYGIMLLFWVALSAAFASAVIALVHRLRPLESVVIVALVFTGLRTGVAGAHDTAHGQIFNDPVFFLLPLLTLFVYLHPAAAVRRWLTPLLIVLTAVTCLIKFTVALLACPVVVLIESIRISRRRFVPVYLFFYIACTIAFFLMAGQRLGGLPGYVGISLSIASGYPEAMQFPGYTLEVTRFLAVAVCLLLLAVHAEWQYGEWRERDWQGVPQLLAFMLFVFLAFKAGFVRHDVHSIIAWSSLSAGAALYASRYCRIVPKAAWRFGMLALCIYVTSLAVSFHQFRAGETLAMFVDGSFGSGLVRRASAAGERIVHPRWTGLIAQREAALAAIRDQNPLPPVSGTVDIYPWNAAVPLAYGMDYVPRPMFQSYQVYGTPLITLNRRHLQSERAASTLIFDVETIDNRFPALDEGELWPDLIAHYDPAGVANGHLLLRRRATPRDVEMQTLSEMRVGWSDPVAVPPDEAPIWTTIRIDKTLFGRLFYVLFKAPPMGVLLTLGNGQQRLHRLVPDAVRYGFVLSPIVDTGVQFEQLIRGDPALRDPGQRVMSFRLVGPPDVTSFYRGSLDVTFQRLFFEHFTGH